ncbi:TetR/AcrR family transcriptional regulator [Streptomyces radicis]|uniref:TetR/AcrR family transcriptional regulator n=1 Tax=Streptomyces radicis TaxID=1750517 RepID=A0A3A9WJ52_9ACTN|nr:TetR/AcrR family transcriptional regulator [Streptomyces radicis]RKN12809.1 TetR/AcrR family transcriptional regulator [Streptomyces radicis]RKN27426.1 TetR/AcrR family transcriptional regulator [Streptomyces radicis]
MADNQAGRGRAMTADDIAHQALELADTRGLEKLTVRSLANRLGIGTMTLYGYFRSKEEILDAVADLALGSLALPKAAPDERPRDAIEAVARAFRRLMSAHPSIVQILSSRVTTSARARRGAMEAVIDRLVTSGIPGPLAVQCYGFILIHALGFSSYQGPRAWAQDDAEDRAELHRQQSHFYASLPIADFPRLVELREAIVELPSEGQFAFAVESLAHLVEARLAGSSTDGSGPLIG